MDWLTGRRRLVYVLAAARLVINIMRQTKTLPACPVGRKDTLELALSEFLGPKSGGAK